MCCKRRPRVNAQLVAEQAPRVLEYREGIGLAPGPVQREHQQLPGPLAKRLAGHQLPQLGDPGRVAAQLDADRQPVFDR
jgi:hypothetical protein